MNNRENQRLPIYKSESIDSEELMATRNQCLPELAPFPLESGSFLPEVIIKRKNEGAESDTWLKVRNISTGAFVNFSTSSTVNNILAYSTFADYQRENPSLEIIANEEYRALYVARTPLITDLRLPCGIYQYVYHAIIGDVDYYFVSDYWEVVDNTSTMCLLKFSALNPEDPSDSNFCGVEFGLFSDDENLKFEFHAFIKGTPVILDPTFTKEFEVADNGKQSLIKTTHKKQFNLSMAQCPVPLCELIQASQHYIFRDECSITLSYRDKTYRVYDLDYKTQTHNGVCAPQITLKIQLDEEVIEAGCLDSPANTCPFEPITIVNEVGGTIAVVDSYPVDGIVTVECGSSSGILYKRPPIGQKTSYVNYDIGWLLDNGDLDFSQPANPQYIQDLDYTVTNWFYTLKYNNAFGNVYRFTNSVGVPASDFKAGFSSGDLTSGGGQANYVIDHLTGFGYYLPNIGSFGSWSSGLSDVHTKNAGFNGMTGWMPMYRNQAVGLFATSHPYYNNAGNIFKRGIVSGVNDVRFNLGETVESTSGNNWVYVDNNTVTYHSKATAATLYIWRIHY